MGARAGVNREAEVGASPEARGGFPMGIPPPEIVLMGGSARGIRRGPVVVGDLRGDG